MGLISHHLSKLINLVSTSKLCSHPSINRLSGGHRITPRISNENFSVVNAKNLFFWFGVSSMLLFVCSFLSSFLACFLSFCLSSFLACFLSFCLSSFLACFLSWLVGWLVGVVLAETPYIDPRWDLITVTIPKCYMLPPKKKPGCPKLKVSNCFTH